MRLGRRDRRNYRKSCHSHRGVIHLLLIPKFPRFQILNPEDGVVSPTQSPPPPRPLNRAIPPTPLFLSFLFLALSHTHNALKDGPLSPSLPSFLGFLLHSRLSASSTFNTTTVVVLITLILLLLFGGSHPKLNVFKHHRPTQQDFFSLIKILK